MSNLFVPHYLVGREAECQRIQQILAQDGDFLVLGAPGIGRRTLIQAAAHKIGAKVIEIDCLRTTSTTRFLQLLAEGLMETFVHANELAFIQKWLSAHPIVLEQRLSHRPRLVWQHSSTREWEVFLALLALPQAIAEWLSRRVVIVFLNFPHMRSWDRSGRWEAYLREEIERQSQVSYALVATVAEPWVQDSNLEVIPLAPLSNAELQSWVVPAMAAEGLEFDPDSQALPLFLSYVQGHLGDAIVLVRRIWFDDRVFGSENQADLNAPARTAAGKARTSLIQAHHVHRSMIALAEDLSVTFESLILLLPPSQVRVLESLALDPTDRPQSRDYIRRHQLSRGGSLQGALASLEQKGLIYGPGYRYRVAFPFLEFWLKQRLG